MVGIMTPVLATLFLSITLQYNAPQDCPQPDILFNTDYVLDVCNLRENGLQPKHGALGCYNTALQLIILPTTWNEHLRLHMDIAEYELRRHVKEACLHQPFNSDNLDMQIVLAAERPQSERRR